MRAAWVAVVVLMGASIASAAEEVIRPPPRLTLAQRWERARQRRALTKELSASYEIVTRDGGAASIRKLTYEARLAESIADLHGAPRQQKRYAALARDRFMRVASEIFQGPGPSYLPATVLALRQAKSVADRFHIPFDLDRAQLLIQLAPISELKLLEAGRLSQPDIDTLLRADRTAADEFGAASLLQIGPVRRQLVAAGVDLD